MSSPEINKPLPEFTTVTQLIDVLKAELGRSNHHTAAELLRKLSFAQKLTQETRYEAPLQADGTNGPIGVVFEYSFKGEKIATVINKNDGIDAIVRLYDESLTTVSLDTINCINGQEMNLLKLKITQNIEKLSKDEKYVFNEHERNGIVPAFGGYVGDQWYPRILEVIDDYKKLVACSPGQKKEIFNDFDIKVMPHVGKMKEYLTLLSTASVTFDIKTTKDEIDGQINSLRNL